MLSGGGAPVSCFLKAQVALLSLTRRYDTIFLYNFENLFASLL